MDINLATSNNPADVIIKPLNESLQAARLFAGMLLACLGPRYDLVRTLTIVERLKPVVKGKNYDSLSPLVGNKFENWHLVDKKG